MPYLWYSECYEFDTWTHIKRSLLHIWKCSEVSVGGETAEARVEGADEDVEHGDGERDGHSEVVDEQRRLLVLDQVQFAVSH